MTPSILISGANRGIGKALAEEFFRHGWKVFAGIRNPEKASDLHPSLEILPLEVTSDKSVAEAAKKVKSTWGKLDVLVNNAGISGSNKPTMEGESLSEVSLETFREVLDTNVIAAVRLVQHFRPLLAEGSKVINVSSKYGSISQKNDTCAYAYSISKAALNMFSRMLATELTAEKIIVVAISPGWVRTGMSQFTGNFSPEESAQSLFRTITSLKMDQTGSFLGKDGPAPQYQW
jgi:NAD(P)-dependent dehydrogenase (short-subunit alcohol dehydrogenase family)